MTTDHHTDDLDLIEQGAKAAADILRKRIDELDAAREAQPGNIADALRRRDILRDVQLETEPWLDNIRAIPMTDAETGEMTGMTSMPSIDGKELWGCRLAFDLAASDGDPLEVLSNYFGHLHGNIEHLFFIQSAALATLIEGLVRPLLDQLEHVGSVYEARVNIAEAAANAWSVRLSGDDQ